MDRFSVEPGVDFQRRLDEDLGDKAFLLLLESENLIESRWVRHEILYALSNRIETLALTLPGMSRDKKVSVIDDAFRQQLCDKDFTSTRILTDDALDRIIEER